MRSLCIRMDEALFRKMKVKQIESGKTQQRYITELIKKDLELAQMQAAKEENDMYMDANKEVFELAEIDGVPVLFTHA